MLPKLIGSISPGAPKIEHAASRVQSLENVDFIVDIERGPGEICALERTQFIASGKPDLRGISCKFLLIVGFMFVGRVGRPAKPQVTGLALQNFDDELLSPYEFYNAGGSTIGADPRLAMPAMVKNAPEVTKFGPNVEESLF